MRGLAGEGVRSQEGAGGCETLPANADHLSYSLRRFFVDRFFAYQVAQLKPRSSVLDLGGLKHKKRGQFDIRQYDHRVVYANLQADKQPDVQADAIQLPFRPSSFDAAICAELLEHVRDPISVLRELYRVIRPQGIVLVTVPFLYPMHGDPSDYGRYTNLYWQEHLTDLGFVDLTIERQGLFWSVIVDMLRSWASEHAKHGWLRWSSARYLVSWIVGIGKRTALLREANPRCATSPFSKSYTTGFGIRFVRP